MEKMELSDWSTVREASEESGYATEYIRQLIRDGAIEATKKGFSWLVSRKSLMDYKDKKTQVN